MNEEELLTLIGVNSHLIKKALGNHDLVSAVKFERLNKVIATQLYRFLDEIDYDEELDLY